MKSLKDLKKENIQDLPQIILMLKDAFCEEMLAHYQYIILADFVEGVDEPLLKKIVTDFKENAKEELEDHAFWILKRLKELGSDWVGIENPNLIDQVATHKYIIPTVNQAITCVEQIAQAERSAIETYTNLVAFTEERDKVTNKKMKEILKDEEKHLKEMETFIGKIKEAWEKEKKDAQKQFEKENEKSK